MNTVAFDKEKQIKFLLTDNLDVVYEMFLHLLNEADLLEHGTTVGGSWLTPKAKEFLADFESFDDVEDFFKTHIDWEGSMDDPNRPKYYDLWNNDLGQGCCGYTYAGMEVIYKILKELE